MIDIATYKQHAEEYLTLTEEARIKSERARDYVLGYQWTAEETEALTRRGQAPIVVNRIKPKVEGLKGLLIQRATDPKAFPRTQAHEDAAHAITDGLRFVADNNDFDSLKLDVADNYIVEGVGGAVVEVKRRNGQDEIVLNRIPWDRIYYDPHSRRDDFEDARYLGVITWLDADVARTHFGKVVDDLPADNYDGETFEDKPRWVVGNDSRRRIRVAMEYFKADGDWHVAYFCGETFLKEPEKSKYVDEYGQTMCPIVLVGCHIDRDNRRFGEVEHWLDLQDEINHRRSKALHLLSQRQTKSVRGAIKDKAELKAELAKADGHVEVDGDSADFDVLPTGDMAQAQFALLEEAKNEIDSVGYNAQLAGERQGNLSGKAILALQGAGANELAALFQKISQWEKRIYRQIWYRIRQTWTAERWIRVTDDQTKLRWVGFNTPITIQQALEEKINDEAEDPVVRKQAAQMFTAMMEAQDPRLQQMAETRNPVAELDVDIKLEQSLDTVNIQQEQFEMLMQYSQAGGDIPVTEILKLSSFRNKDELIEGIEEAQKAAGEAAQQAAQAQFEQEQKSVELELRKDMTLQSQKLESQERIKAAELELENEKLQMQIQSERIKAGIAIGVEREKAALTRDTAKVSSAAVRDPVIRIDGADALTEAMGRLAASNDSETAEIDQLIAAINKPRTVQRDSEGRVAALV